MPVDTQLPVPGSPQTRPNAPAEGTQWPGQAPTGPGVGDTGGAAPTAPPTGLPPGTHPGDPSTPYADPFADITKEASAPHTPRHPAPFGTDNADAFPVNQRAASHWRGGVVVVNANASGTAQVVGRVKGRTRLRLWLPSQIVVGGAIVTVPALTAVLIGATEGELQGNFGGILLSVNDPPIDIESEGSVAIGLAPGAVIGYVQYLETWDPPGGGIVGNT